MVLDPRVRLHCINILVVGCYQPYWSRLNVTCISNAGGSRVKLFLVIVIAPYRPDISYVI